ncbi:MAG: ComEC/Rec2 family competence protein [Candidatus Xenobia bacterium]
MRCPSLLLAACVLVGLVFPWRPALLVALPLLLLGGWGRWRWTPWVGMMLIGSAVMAAHPTVDPLVPMQGRLVGFEGTVAGPPRGATCTLDVGVPVVMHGPHLRWGDVVHGEGTLERISARNPGEPAGVGYQIQVRHFKLLRRTRSIGILLHDLCLRGLAKLAPDQTPFLSGVLLGDANGLSPDLQRAMRRTGTSHLLVASGLKVTAVAWLIATVLATLPLPPPCRLPLALAGVALYCGAAGAPWPTMRAAGMGTLALCARTAGDAWDGLNALGLTALVLMLIDSHCVADPGFQLSCLAMAALSVCLQPCEAVLAWLPRPIRGAAAATLCIQIAVWPFQAAQTHCVSLIAVLANAAVVPMAEALVLLVLPLAMLAGAGWVVPGAPPLVALAARLVVSTTLALAQCPHAMLALPGHAPPHGMLTVTFLDVGQGDAAWIDLPDGGGILIDAGPCEPDGSFSAGERVVAPFLLRHGVARIPLAVMTHPHLDHYGGFPALADLVPLDDLVECGLPGNGPVWDALRAPRCERWRAGQRMRWGEVEFTVLHPGPVLSPSPNNASIVLKMAWRQVSFLFAGDAEAPAEDEMLARDPDALAATVLKVPHHGSATSSTAPFLAAVHPQVAVVSVARENRFGLPDPATMARLSAMVPHLYRTDVDGGVVVSSDGKRLTVAGSVPAGP